jgi:hypothetical protein
MPLPVLAALPDDLRSWEGNIHELAARCDELRPALGLEDDEISPNERLLRHYLQAGILSPPRARQGREAVFGGGHVVEYLVARYLLSKEGWRLSNVADINRESNWHAQLAASGASAPSAAPAASSRRAKETDAQQAIQRIRSREAPAAAAAAAEAPADVTTWASRTSLQHAAAISSRRAHLKDALTQLGNPAGEPERHRMIRLRLTPWCEVLVDAVALERLDEGTTDLLGQALTHALREERLHNKGGRT